MEALESTLRPILTPLTQNLPQPLPHLATQILGPVCYTSLVENLTLTDSNCLTLAISKTLGIAIIAASSIVKIPQLLKLLNSQSAAGISFLSYALETASYLVTLVYNIRNGWPFSTYGETALIAVQNVAIAVLVLKYSGKGAAGIAFVAGLAALGWTLFNEGIVDMGRLRLVQGAAGVLGVASKVPQILTIWREGSTGQLSAFAVFNFLAGSLARIFTTLQEVDDKLILYGYLVGFALNLVLAVQMVWYWNSSSTETKQNTKIGKTVVEQAVGGGKSSSVEKGKSPSTRRRG